MAAVGAIFSPLWMSSPTKSTVTASSRFSSSNVKAPKRPLLNGSHTLSPSLSTLPSSSNSHFSLRAASSSSVGSIEYAEEPATKVKFQTSLSLPGCSTSLSLLGTGYREKVFAIVGVKVYAAGFYLDQAIYATLESWQGRPAAELQQDSSLFDAIFQAPLEKALQIVLVRDVDGKTFWDALDEAVSPRIKSRTPVDESALSIFRSVFQGRPLKKGTFIFLTWLNPVKIIVSVSSDGIPSAVDATFESENVTSALFDVFLGTTSVSPSLKASVAKELAATLKRSHE